MSRPFLRRYDRYVMAEILPLLVAGLVVVMLAVLVGALLEVIAPLLAKGASPALVARLVALQLPEAIKIGLPVGFLFATLLGLSRLSSDAEIKAALAGGVAPGRLFLPVLLMGVGVTVAAFVIGETLGPRAKTESLSVQRQIVLDNPRVLGLDQPGLILRDALNRAISVTRVRPGGVLEGVRVVALRESGGPSSIITAREGHLRDSNVLELLDGQRITYQDGRPVTVIRFRRGELPVQDLQASFKTSDAPKPIDTPLPQLWAKVQTYAQQHVNAPQETTALQRKFAEPLAALAMGFFAVALALFTFRSGLNVGLVWVLLLTFAYYASWSVFRVMGESGALPPVVAAWTPDVLYLVAGLVLLAIAARR
ncbi:LptF/LptG family permease [Deinococcus maricopensis]|uniref:Permease YjgP/YjgQ family protein n=1 Tax=Deinococcus maricopensis (strain DSM 21211 / LMG 22137 / NRRL B-23946 / LB-34) TaxID=709986 RepID=E8U4J8_DEIML|nr:LptF/LptG family permease [Deinococcus maricopensis]ADV68863.1 permease YjgP/YjgQ family protein [Deinococcus maricopensis DSM 21211]